MGTRNLGFSLVELMVSLAIVAGVLVGAWASFNSFVGITRDTISATEREEDVTIALNLLSRDLRSSGFGVSRELRMATEDGGPSSVGVAIAENDAVVALDINGDGDMGDTSYADRLFSANGVKLMRDSTTHNDEDDQLTQALDPVSGQWIPIAGIIAERMGSEDMTGGYYADLTADVASGASSLGLVPHLPLPGGGIPTDLNINAEAETTISAFRDRTWDFEDFSAQAALIVGGAQSADNTDFHVEGHRTGNSKTALAAASATMGADTMLASYRANRAKVVPAVAWYIDKKTNDDIYWLYRNNDKVLADALDFQLTYGFDRNGDGLEWASHIPPDPPSEIDVSERAEVYEDLSSGMADRREIVRSLKAVHVALRVRKGEGVVARYETTVRLRK